MMSRTPPTLPQVAACGQRSPIGKALPQALYVHVSAIAHLDPCLQACDRLARPWLDPQFRPTLVKFSFEKPQLSYLAYPDFDREPHPALQASYQVNWQSGEHGYRDYSDAANPPVLHRKETFVHPDYPGYETFQHLSRQQEALGLLEDSRSIGSRLGWEQRLAARGLELWDHALACPLRHRPTEAQPAIARHKAAIVRRELSKPARLAVAAGLLPPGTTFFDYGCGHGSDSRLLSQQGCLTNGWDPYYQPDSPRQPAQVVNLGYVINVIEDPAERREALVQAWALAEDVLIVAAQVLVSDRTQGLLAYGDGIITSRNTFQKYYDQDELKAYIDQGLGVDAIPVALGIYFVFRDPARAEQCRASCFRSRATTPRVCLRVKRFEDYQPLLQPLMDFYLERGRLPVGEEGQQEVFAPAQAEFGSLRRAFKLVLQATQASDWEAIAEKRRQDLLIYLALSRFDRRPRFCDLAPAVQQDIKTLLGSYAEACIAADLLLASLGQQAAIAAACHRSPLGQQRPHSLWVHISALENLEPLLRLYEGCAAQVFGRPETATLVKLHTHKPQITYLECPDFDRLPHPPIQASMQIHLREQQVNYRDYRTSDDPPLLHQKEQTLAPDYPLYEKFAKLSQQEQSWGLLDDLPAIFSESGWQRCLAAHGATLKGHRVVWRQDADPSLVKRQRARRRSMTAANA